jgi:hypothetical protein
MKRSINSNTVYFSVLQLIPHAILGQAVIQMRNGINKLIIMKV